MPPVASKSRKRKSDASDPYDSDEENATVKPSKRSKITKTSDFHVYTATELENLSHDELVTIIHNLQKQPAPDASTTMSEDDVKKNVAKLRGLIEK